MLKRVFRRRESLGSGGRATMECLCGIPKRFWSEEKVRECAGVGGWNLVIRDLSRLQNCPTMSQDSGKKGREAHSDERQELSSKEEKKSACCCVLRSQDNGQAFFAPHSLFSDVEMSGFMSLASRKTGSQIWEITTNIIRKEGRIYQFGAVKKKQKRKRC